MVNYMFIARQTVFSQNYDRAVIKVDAFHQVRVPFNLVMDETAMKVAEKIQPDLGNKDVSAYMMMQLRLRYNSDMYPHVLLVKTENGISPDELELYLNNLESEELLDWLKKSEMG